MLTREMGPVLLLLRKILLNRPHTQKEMVDAASIVIIATAFALGMAHSLDPDHIVAVSTLLCGSTSLRRSVWSAVAWGGGHSIVLLIVGLILLVLRIEIPAGIVVAFELAAGGMLILIGAWVARPFLNHVLRSQGHNHEHGETEEAQSHVHSHGHRNIHKHSNGHAHNRDDGHLHLSKSARTGVLQGLGGSAAIMLVMVATVNSLALGFAFIVVFGIGVILGMVSIARLISSLLKYTATHLESIHEKIKAVTGTISIVFGAYIIVQILRQL
jgi:ABC-type nickel/cobalt efflux system permease component RcnA